MSPDRRRVRVVAAAAHPLYRDALTRAVRQRPELELVAAVCDGRDALAAITSEQPDVAVVDRALSGLGGDSVLDAVVRDRLPTRVVMIAAEPEPRMVYAAIAAGASGYLTKDVDANQLCDAIAAVSRGQSVLAADVHAGIASEIRLRATDDRPFLSDRESEILRLVAEGQTAPEIGRTLRLGTPTVKTHLHHVYEKLGVAERAAAVAAAMRRGLLE
jgi:two-component system, NarL family, nitrate/nitrite response regulator NarL